MNNYHHFLCPESCLFVNLSTVGLRHAEFEACCFSDRCGCFLPILDNSDDGRKLDADNNGRFILLLHLTRAGPHLSSCFCFGDIVFIVQTTSQCYAATTSYDTIFVSETIFWSRCQIRTNKDSSAPGCCRYRKKQGFPRRRSCLLVELLQSSPPAHYLPKYERVRMRRSWMRIYVKSRMDNETGKKAEIIWAVFKEKLLEDDTCEQSHSMMDQQR
ncbi:hypothetical protein Y032_0040g308 [Ancylostoma ceylanicum]|nr:hypothetical protein Y032_0040g308 [Ancylostoma ceylanicum]